MALAPLIDNGQYSKPNQNIFTSTDLDIALAETEILLGVDPGASLDRAVSNLSRRNISATGELVKVARAVN